MASAFDDTLPSVSDGDGATVSMPHVSPAPSAFDASLPTAPPEKSRPPILGTSWLSPGNEPWDVPGGGALKSVKPQEGAVGGLDRYIDTSLTPGPNVGDIVPLSRDPATGRVRLALPNIVRGLTTEGPQLDSQGQLTVPGATINPNTGTFGVTPAAQLSGSLAAPGPLRWSGPQAPMGLGFGGREITPGEVRRELAQPPAPTLSDLLQRQRSAPTTDPTTAAAIDLLRTRTQPTAMPQPPTPFAPSQQPPITPIVSPTVAPRGGGLLGPLPGNAPFMTAEEMLAQSKAGYAPADRAAAQGATINPAAADKLRGVLVDAVPDDPQTAIGKGNTPLIQLGQQYKPFQGQPMTYDAAMTLDKRLTAEKNAAASTPGGATLATDIGNAQDAFRDKLESLGDSDTTGDASTLANLPAARKAFSQYRKQSQLDDIEYNASLQKTEDAQNASRRSQVVAMLKNDNKMRGWSDDERTALETQLKSGNIGSLTNFGLGLFKPAGKIAGGLFGSPLGVGGTVVGGEIGGELGAMTAARLRASLSKLQLDPVSQALTANMPPPPAGWTTTSRP